MSFGVIPIIGILFTIATLPIFGQIPSLSLNDRLDSSLSGAWSGDVFNAVGARSRVIIHIVSYVNGPCDATWDAPTYAWIGNRFTSVSCSGRSILLRDDSADVVFTGTFTEEPLQITGQWEQRRTNSPVVFRKLYEAPRTQEQTHTAQPVRVEMSAPNRPAGVIVGAELALPDTLGRYATVILAGDHETADRDGRDESGHAPFRVLTSLLLAKNIAVVRLDDRGTGRTTGTNDAESVEDEASDIGVVLGRIMSHPNVDTARIVLVGHGEGGLAVSIVANRWPTRVARLTLLCTPSVAGAQALVEQIAARERRMQTDEELIGVATGLISTWCSALGTGVSDSIAVGRLLAIADSTLEARPDLLSRYPLARQLKQVGREAYMTSTIIPWLRRYIWYNPAPYLTQIRRPMLALYAQRDTEVPGEVHAKALRELVTENRNLVLEVVPDVNHWLQPCDVCDNDERMRTELSIQPSVVDRLARWVLQGR